MGRRLLAFGVLACVAIGSSAQDGSTGSPNQEQCSQDSRDVIVKVSRPYLQFSITD